jgi:hypothetical protein
VHASQDLEAAHRYSLDFGWWLLGKMFVTKKVPTDGMC